MTSLSRALRKLLPGLGMATAIAAAVAMSTSGPAAAADSAYPSQPIHLIVGFAPGGATDILSRAVAQKLSVALKGSVIVENLPGANANIGAQRAAHSPADGYTIMMASVPNAVNASLYKNLTYDAVNGFVPIISVATVPMVLTVSSKSPIHSVAELIAAAKAQPGHLSFSSGGVGSQEQISGLMLEQATGVELTHVPYKGSGLSITDLMGGRISLAFNTIPSVMPYIKAGSLRPLALCTEQPSDVLPGVPTMIQAGVPGFVSSQWYGFVAPKGTPPKIIALLNKEIGKILKEPEMQKLFVQLGAQPTGGTPEEFGKFYQSEIKKNRKIVTDFKLNVDS